MSDRILVNQWGATRGAQRFASTLLEAINSDYGMTATNPNDAAREGEEGRGLQIELYDKILLEFTEFEGYDAVTWMEDDSDVLIQLYPPHGRAAFDDLEWVLRMELKMTRGRTFYGYTLRILVPC